MADILQTKISETFPWIKFVLFLIKFPRSVFLRDQYRDWTGDKPLLKPMIIQFPDERIITCRLWVFYVREDNYSNVLVMITWLIWTIWTPVSSVPKKADKLNLSLDERMPPHILTRWDRMTHNASINKPSLVQIMACCLVSVKPLSEPMLGYC